jgi:hypothetical protein
LREGADLMALFHDLSASPSDEVLMRSSLVTFPSG